jgi:hypothetical protein
MVTGTGNKGDPYTGILPQGSESEPGKVMVARWRLDHQPHSTVSASTARDKSVSPDAPAANIFSLVPKEVSPRNAFRDKLFAMFIDSDLSVLDVSDLGFGVRNDWMVQVVNLPELSPTLEAALLAVCTARLGRHAGQPTLVQQSLNHMRMACP